MHGSCITATPQGQRHCYVFLLIKQRENKEDNGVRASSSTSSSPLPFARFCPGQAKQFITNLHTIVPRVRASRNDSHCRPFRFSNQLFETTDFTSAKYLRLILVDRLSSFIELFFGIINFFSEDKYSFFFSIRR